MTTIWRIRLHTNSDYSWFDYFAYAPTPQDVRDIMGRIPHCPAPLLELAEHIPDDYTNQMGRNGCSSITYRAETGTIIIRKEAVHTARE